MVNLRSNKRDRSTTRNGDSPVAKKLAHDNHNDNENDTDANAISEMSIADPALSETSTETDDSVLDKKRDTFCWTCHKTAKAKLKCTSCSTAYHGICLLKSSTKSIQNGNGEWKCPECQLIAQNRDHEMEMSSGVTIVGLLQIAMRSIVHKHEPFVVEAYVPSGYVENDLLVNPVTLTQIIDKVTNGEYANTDEFLLDFKWLNHNFNVMASQGGDNAKDLKDLKKHVKRMLNESIGEVDDIRNCCNCYFNRDQPNAVVMSNENTDMEDLKKQGEIHAIEISKLNEEVRAKNDELKELREQLRLKNEESESRRLLLQEAHVQLISRVKEAKNKLWCIECGEMLPANPTETCEVCSIFCEM